MKLKQLVNVLNQKMAWCIAADKYFNTGMIRHHQLINQTLIKTNHARVAYDTSQLAVIKN